MMLPESMDHRVSSNRTQAGGDCGAKATKSPWQDPKTAVVIVDGPGLKQNAPSFPDSGSGSEQ